jgi:dienelactone hydrolase
VLAVTRPIVEGFLRAVRAEPGVDRLVVVGFCFGGRYALLVAGGPLPLADVAVAYHPVRLSSMKPLARGLCRTDASALDLRQSLVAVPADVQRIAVPTCIIIGDHDEWMPLARVRKVESVFAALRSKDEGLKAEVIVYEGVRLPTTHPCCSSR